MRDRPVHVPVGRFPGPETSVHVLVMTPPQILAILGPGRDIDPHSRPSKSLSQVPLRRLQLLNLSLRAPQLCLLNNFPIVRRLMPQARTAKYVSEMRREPEDIMPEVVVYMLEGRTLDQKRGLIKDITAAVVKNAGAPPDAVTVSLVESPKTSKGKGGVLFSEMPSH